MKILFTADLHIRIGQKNIPKAWALNQYDIMFKEFNRVFEDYNCELEIHGGDIFDKTPTMEELAVYMGYISRTCGRDRIIYDGNHEATKKGDTFLKYLEPMLPDNTKLFTTYIKDHPYCYSTVSTGVKDFEIIPYTELHNLDSIEATSKILFTHVRGEIPPHVKPEVNLDCFNQWDIVFAGDLHAHSNSQRNIVYPGSPRTVSFHRNEVKLGVLVIDTEPLKWEWVEITVPQLIRKTVDNPEDIVKTDFHHTIYELTGNILDLAKIDKDSDLLDKKIIQHEEKPTLDLYNLTMEEELEKYLTDIISLPKIKIQEVMEIYNDYI